MDRTGRKGPRWAQRQGSDRRRLGRVVGRRASVDDPEAQRPRSERDRTTRVCHHSTGRLGSSCLRARLLPHCSSEPPCLSWTIAGKLAQAGQHSRCTFTWSPSEASVHPCTTTGSDTGVGGGGVGERLYLPTPLNPRGRQTPTQGHLSATQGARANHAPSEDGRPRGGGCAGRSLFL